jgi:hypothetical protein
MPIHSPAFDLVTSALAQPLAGLPPKVIAITGPYLSGKTTLARYLAWYFNISLIETDLFLVSGPPLKYRNEEIERIISRRLAMPRPVIVDGAAVLDLFALLGRTPDLVIKLSRSAPSKSAASPVPSPTITAIANGSSTTFEVTFCH